ncbi:histidine--tRNA ligase [Patescibacteria group bacterium]|nr:histidine--tRNA ligase [Patescibacteria group bacterium]
MNKKNLSTQPYRGSRDFYPEDMRYRNYMFDIWRKVCKSYGFEEYDGPFIESFDIYAAKSGEEIVNEQLYSFEDRGGRKVAIRPEMTPTVARMVAQKHKELTWPVKWFSIPNLWRYEKPQRGRLREHFQLNVDIFGDENVTSDFEVINIAVDIMKAFGATSKTCEIRISNRRLIDDIYDLFEIPDNKKSVVSKCIDKIRKVTPDEFQDLLSNSSQLTSAQIDYITKFLQDPKPFMDRLSKDSRGTKEIEQLIGLFEKSENRLYVKFDPSIMRGFDYYTGSVFEQFDLNPNNTRSMYGGGRYDDLVDEFIDTKIPGVGWGMGDVTMKLFLENWKLLPDITSSIEYFVTLWPEDKENKFFSASNKISNELRKLGKSVDSYLTPNTKLDKQLKYADKKDIRNVIIIGDKEIESESITVKDMSTGKQETKRFDDFLNGLK